MARKTGITVGAVGITAWATIAVLSAHNDHREAERESRERDVFIAATAYLDPIKVTETDEIEGTIKATLIHTAGGSALSACKISYSKHPADNRTFDPNFLDLSDCFSN